MSDKNQPAVNQWNSAWSYPFYPMYSSLGYNAQGPVNMQYYQNAYAAMYQNTLMQQQYMRNFLPGGKLGGDKSEEKNLETEKNEEKSIQDNNISEMKEDLPPLPPGSPPKTPPPPEISLTPKSNPVKFNIAGKNAIISPPKPINAFMTLTAKQKKKKKNKMLKKLQAEALKTDNSIASLDLYKVPLPQPVQTLNSFQSIPIPSSFPLISKDENGSNVEQENKNTSSVTNTSNDSFAKIDKVKSTMDMKEWPHSLTEYVNRCYSKCKTNEEKDQIGDKLKTKILQAASSELLWVKDWDNEPMPLLESELSTLPQTPVCKQGVYQGGRNIFIRSSEKKNRNNSYSKYLPPSHHSFQNDNTDDSSPKYSKKSSASESNWNKKQKRRSEDYIPIKNSDEDGGKSSPMSKMKSKRPKKFSLGGVDETPIGLVMDKVTMEKRAARFSLGNRESEDSKNMNAVKSLSLVWNSTLSFNEDRTPEATAEHIVGTCQDIEKQYLRLTSALEASSIRPPEVLSQSLARVKEKWLANQDYHYACEQLKSIRQDLTVQGIRDALTVDVYETHARIALEKGDHYEFNQCQSQLKLLYSEVDESANNSYEFTCYRILYYIFTKDTTDLIKTVVELRNDERDDACVSFALKLSSACTMNNYKLFFKLYKQAPRMASYLIDLFVPRVRKSAITTMIKAYRPHLPVSYIKDTLGFESDTQCTVFLKEMDLIFADNEMSKIDCKASSAKLPTATVRSAQ